MLARTCNQKPCELAQFETTLRMALPAARISCRACHVRCRHDVEPEERFKLNRNKYHAVVAARKRPDTVGEIADQAARAAKRDTRVGASGRLVNQAARRSKLSAAAAATFCRPALANPR